MLTGDGLGWIAEAYPLGYSVILCEGLAPEEILVRLGGSPEAFYPLTRDVAQLIEVGNSMEEPYDLDDMDGIDEETLDALGFLRPEANAIIRAGPAGAWSFAIQASTSYVSASDYLPALSRGTRVVAASTDVNATQRVEYAVDGRTLSSFDPLFRHYDDGPDPLALPWPPGEPLGPRQVLEQLETDFGIWVPRDSENQRLPAAALSAQWRHHAP
ncbi:DUF6461 domain-containing protein [Streptomyces sp. R35]|uniref:DUF6461 domain-containing protein n=1 Tax=Streptomyces sp. R35 TaxID=3238630 RepID=A0AB39S7T4_9ACTN